MYEIERKFLVNINDPTLQNKLKTANKHNIIQGYIFDDDKGIMRIRKDNNNYCLMFKNKSNDPIKCIEVEHEISQLDGEIYLLLLDNKISKTRYNIDRWELDVFHGKLKGLYVAEIELEYEDESFNIPDWVGEEVTCDMRYKNSNLLKDGI